MIPPLIVNEALAKNIKIIAITDHNQTANIQAVQEAAKGTGITVLPGMELQTREDIHVLCLFDKLDQAWEFQKLVDSTLPDFKNNPEFFGEQFVVDHTGEFIRREKRLLINSTTLSIKEALEAVNDLNGLLIPAHVTRNMFGLFPALGFIPENIIFEALEISVKTDKEKACKQFPQIGQHPLIRSGDAHYLADILGKNEFFMKEAKIHEIKMAFRQKEGRSVKILD